MRIGFPWLHHWPWPPFAVGFVLLLPSLYLATTTPSDHPFTLPKSGGTTEIDVVNGGYRSLFGDHAFMLFYEIGVPADNSVGLPERPPVQCSFRLVDARSGKPIAAIGELDHAYDGFAENKAGFSSEPFELTTGTTRVKITNAGCRPGSTVASGVGRINQFREMLLVPIAASILQFIALVSISVGLAIGVIQYVGARLRTWRIARG